MISDHHIQEALKVLQLASQVWCYCTGSNILVHETKSVLLRASGLKINIIQNFWRI